MASPFIDPSPARRRQRGFTLIELMMTVAIAAILAAVALPMYRTYVMRSRIIDGTSKLSDFRVRMEQFFMDNRTYANGADCGVPNPADTGDATFTIECTGATAVAYTVTAKGKDAKGMKDFEYQIVQSGAKKTNKVPTGWTSKDDCWVTNRDGSC